LREHTRLLQRASEWDTGGRPSNRLLSGEDIRLAKAWVARRPQAAPAPTALHLDFIKASEDWETRQQSAERRALEEMASGQAAREAALADRETALKQESAAKRRASRITLGLLATLVLTTIAISLAVFAATQYSEALRNFVESQKTESRLRAEQAARADDGVA